MAVSQTSTDNMRLVRRGPDAIGDQAAALFALANGLVGVEGVIDERSAAPCAYLPDAFVSRPIRYHESFPGYATATDTRIKCPSPLLLRLQIDGHPIDFAEAELLDTVSSLDLATGQLNRTSRWRVGAGRTLEIAVARIVPLAGAACVASRIVITPVDFAAALDVWLTYGLDGGHAAGADADDPRISGRLRSAWTIMPGLPGDAVDVTRFGQADVALAYRQHVTSAADVTAVEAGHMVRGDRAAGAALAIDRMVAMTCGRGGAIAPLPSGEMAIAFDMIAQGQRDAVGQLWAGAALAIDGDDALTQALRFDLFQLHQSATRDANHSIAAKGLSGEGYEGHYFWDAEAFMLPVLALQAPEKARTLLTYRIGKLDHARAHAAAMGHGRGALYPWRTIAGDECSSHYPTGSAQYHINADIAHGVALYVAATGDDNFRRAAARMLFETARI